MILRDEAQRSADFINCMNMQEFIPKSVHKKKPFHKKA